ncbi:periplasmic solute binding protein [Thermaerobacter marianensis DSM 12885]|uniref:Periplasmic solute binding protein n=1 Tax=Thermaerobacter marianensis (strain ATCC 700841 / DSM 12885 / JCM 10246 / 7p75a) TaxID=644966 RepID=E6SJ30_THEM7|nr:zinc ABC transporter substrate-binding protein [Thermaerobacter marianensis]ADU52054.1 periplasmic solute binding protein [Thermaerobacter marianensis DSM 12885]
MRPGAAVGPRPPAARARRLDSHRVGLLRRVPAAVVVVALMVGLSLGGVLAAGQAWWAKVAGAGDPRPLVVASTTILADLAAQIGGERVRVYSLLAPGQDPHSYEPVPRDALALSRARLVLLNGYGLDLWAERLLGGLPVEPAGAGRRATPGPPAAVGGPVSPAGGGAAGRPVGAGPMVVRVAESLPAASLPGGAPLPWPGDPARTDPHLWMDPALVTGYVDVIRDALSGIDPAGAGFYRQRAEQLRAQLASLDAWIARQVQAVPPDRRLLVTTHDAYRYFGRRYGLRVVDTIWGISTEEEPAAADLARLMDRLRRYGVPAFVESTINPKLMEELAAQAGVPIGGRLYADSVGPPGSGAETYVGMMRHNVRVITAALREGPRTATVAFPID